MPTARQTIEGRWHDAAYDAVPYLAPLSIGMKTSFALVDKIIKVRDEVAQNPHLSPIGRKDAVRKAIGSNLGNELHRSRKVIAAARDKVAAWRKRLEVLPIDPSDAASAVLRSEMRGMIRQMSAAERVGMLMSGTADNLTLLSILEAPDMATGIKPEHREAVRSQFVKQRFAKDVAAIEQAESAIALAEVATKFAVMEARSAGEFANDAEALTFVDENVLPRSAGIDAEVERDFVNFGRI